MACDRPVVATAVGVFENPGSHPFGVIVDKVDVEALSDGIKAVLNDPAAFEPRDYAQDRFGFERFSKAWIDLVAEMSHG